MPPRLLPTRACPCLPPTLQWLDSLDPNQLALLTTLEESAVATALGGTGGATGAGGAGPAGGSGGGAGV